MGKKNKGSIGGQFTPLLHEMLDAAAWLTLSHGAKTLYVALKRRADWAGNRAYLSYWMARRELKAGPHKIKEWFAELEHYGFIVMVQHGSLGVDGKGKAPHWRLTEKGNAGHGELPTKDYLRWTGELFDPSPYRDARGRTKWEKQKPVTHVHNGVLPTYVTPPLPTSITPEPPSVTHVGDITWVT